jgi:hypothetical protein
MNDKFAKWKEYTLLKFRYTLNYKNIQAGFNNNVLYVGPLITDPQIVIPDGLYDVLDLNEHILYDSIGGFFYQIARNRAGTGWTIW